MASSNTSMAVPPSTNAYNRVSSRSLYSAADMASFTCIEDVERWNTSLELHSRDVDAQLAEQLKDLESIRFGQRQVFGEYLPSILIPLVSDSSRLEKSLVEASVVAEEVSRKVRVVDVIRKRAVEALDRANDAIALKQCVDGVHVSLRAGDFERAVEHMAVYLRFSATGVVDSETSAVMARAEAQLLNTLREQLGKAIANNSISDMTRLTRLFSPLGLFDEGVRHYATYLEKQIDTDLVAITQAAKESERTAEEKGTGEKASFASAISQITQRAHARLKRAKPVLEQAFGSSGLLHAVLLLQPILSSHISTLIDQFLTSWAHFKPQLSDVASFTAHREASSSSSSFISLSSYGASNTTLPSAWNPMLFAPLLDQLVIICQTIEVHSRFANAVVAQAYDAHNKEKNKSPSTSNSSSSSSHNTELSSSQPSSTSVSNRRASIDNNGPSGSDNLSASTTIEAQRDKIDDFSKKLLASVQMGPLNERLLELLSHYMKFEQHYMQRSVEHVLDALSTGEESRLASVVDDVFFLLKESSNRARATYNANTLCTVTNFIDAELNGAYYESLQDRSSRESLQLARTQPAPSHNPTSFGQQHSSARTVLVAINQLEQTANYISRLKTDVEEPAKKIFSSTSSNKTSTAPTTPSKARGEKEPLVAANTTSLNHDLEKVLICCEELLRTEAKYRNLITSQIQQIVEAMQPRFTTVFAPIAQATYNVTMELYSQFQINDPYMVQLLQGLAEILGPIEHVLTPTNASVLTVAIMKLFVKQLERAVTKKTFTQLGAEQMDRDMRKCVEFFTPRTPTGTARDSFHRLLQIAYLLNFDTLEEIQEEWNARIANRTELDRPAWSLSPTDLKRVLSLRRDFSKDLITTLVLRDR